MMLDQILQMGILGIVLVLGSLLIFLGMTVGLTALLYHRRGMAKMMMESKRSSNVNERIEELEKRYAKLEESNAHAHMLIADEQRQLDRQLERKLTTLLPDKMPDHLSEPDGDKSRRRGRRSRESASE